MVCINFYLNIFSILTVKSGKKDMNDCGSENFCYKNDMNNYDQLEEKITPIISEIYSFLYNKDNKRKVLEDPIEKNVNKIDGNLKNSIFAYKIKYLNDNFSETGSYLDIFKNVMEKLRDKQLNSKIQDTDENSIIDVLLMGNSLNKIKIYQYYLVFSIIQQRLNQESVIQNLIPLIKNFYGAFIKAFCPNCAPFRHEHLPQYLKSQYISNGYYRRKGKEIESDKTKRESKKKKKNDLDLFLIPYKKCRKNYVWSLKSQHFVI